MHKELMAEQLGVTPDVLTEVQREATTMAANTLRKFEAPVDEHTIRRLAIALLATAVMETSAIRGVEVEL